jgi:hypothetical protein
MSDFNKVIGTMRHNQSCYIKDTEPWKEYELAISVLQQEHYQADVINAFEKFLANYSLLNLHVKYNPTEREYTLAEVVDEMKNRTEVGKEIIQKIYYRVILDLVEGEDI